jgi:predicted secreted protein
MTGDNIKVAMGEEFIISLRTIATAGYLWKVESLPDGIQLLKTEHEKRAGDAKPGDAINQIFEFRAQRKGEHKITFVLARPWENKPRESRTVTVNAT